VLGFATVDLSTRDDTLTVWLTSVQDATHAGHTNAVTFGLGEDTTPRRALSMICDRYVVLTDRTPSEDALLIGWGAEPCDLAMLAGQTTAAQAAIMAAFREHRSKWLFLNPVRQCGAVCDSPVNAAGLECRQGSW
jgi:hypothetical protein